MSRKICKNDKLTIAYWYVQSFELNLIKEFFFINMEYI